MPANVESMFWVDELPWHGLGNELPAENYYEIEPAIKAAGLDWEVGLKPLYHKLDSGELSELDCRFATVRSDTGAVLGTVGPQSKPFQNAAAFEWFKPFLESRQAAFHTAGSLDEGRKVWVLAKLNLDNVEVVKGDEIAKFLLLSNSHDGTTAIRVGFSPIRVVCANTLGMAHTDKSSASKLLRVKHHKSIEKTMEKIRDVINLANQEFEATAEQYRYLASKPVSVADLERFVKTLLGCEEKEEISSRTENMIKAIRTKVENGRGQHIPGVEGTWWAAYNGYTEWLSYVSGHNSDTRMKSLWFGQNAAKNKEALELAVEFANAA